MVMKKSIKTVLFIISAVLLLSPLGACTKGGESSATAAAGSTASTAAAKTTVKTTAKASITATAAMASTAATATKAAAMETAAPETGDGQVTESGSGEGTVGVDEYLDEYDPAKGVVTSEKVAEIEVFDLKGREIIFAMASPSYTYESWSKLTPETVVMIKRLDYLQKLNNCKIKMVPYPGWSQVQTALMSNCLAGTYWADIMLFNAAWTMKFHEFVQPLNEFIDLDNSMINNPGQFNLKWDGKYYSVLFQGLPGYGEEMMTYNRDIFGREGLPDLLELQRAGQWTWNVMLDFAIKATRDFDGDGIVDQWGLVRDSVLGVAAVVKMMIVSNDGRIIDNSSGDYRLAIADPKALKALYFLNDLQNVYKTGPIYAGSTAFKLGKAAMAFSNLNETRKTRIEYPAGSTAVLYPKGPDTDKFHLLNINVGGWSGALPYFVDDPEKVAKVIYGLCAVYDDTYPEYVAEPVVSTFFSSYVFTERDFESFELQKTIIKSEGAVMDPYAYLTADLDSLLLAGNKSLIYSIMEMNVPVQTAVDTVRDAVSEKIKTMVETYRRIR